MPRQRTFLACLLVTAALASAGNASAIYLMTPLTLQASALQGDVGDTLQFALGPNNETEAANWGGKGVRVAIQYSDETENGAREVIVESLTLDGAAKGSFEWVLPAALDNKTIAIQVESLDTGETVATTHIGVGHAPVVLAALESASGPSEPGTTGDLETAAPDGGEKVDTTGDDAKDVPVPAALVAIGLAGAAMLVARRRA